MGPINLRVRYRPIRLGWCVKQGDLEEVRKALRLTHTFWGGRFNPIIPLGDPELARQLIKTFRVDCLYCLSESPEGTAILNEFDYLPWPTFNKELFVDVGNGQRQAAFLDVFHPVRHLYEEEIKDREKHSVNGTMFRWDPTDPLADVFLATFGAYPSKSEIGKDYDKFFMKFLASKEIPLTNGAAVPATAFKNLTPSVLTTIDLGPVGYDFGWDEPGLYHGDGGSFNDITNFWNLRASGIQLYFYDPSAKARLGEMADSYLAELRARPKSPQAWRDRIAVWKPSHETEIDLTPFGADLTMPYLSPRSWNGVNIKPSVMGFEEKSVLGTATEAERLSVTFELPTKPFFDDFALHTQQVVVSVHPLVTTENIVLKAPFFPPLNEYYGRQAYFLYNAVRSEREGIGIIEEVTNTSLTIRALDVRTLVKEIFEAFGISAKPSSAGLLGLRLIEQMGGLQGCRVFKISGVRDLIRAHLPSQSFTRSGAVMTIGPIDPVTKKPVFADYDSLYHRGSLKPQEAFNYLLKKGVFQAGLRLLCPNCELDSWVHLDDARTVNRCEYCGKDFNITPQLKDRDWAYRRSGLFGRDDHQRGGIPVALMLQQLQTAMHDRILAYTTGTDLDSITADIQKCETDFVLIVEAPRTSALQIAIGECKSDGGEITADDVTKLTRVADALSAKRSCDAFIVFSKTSSFTLEEVERCKAAQAKYHRRVILLSERELKPYYLYEQTAKEFEIDPYASSFEQMAQATHNIYFEPRPKPGAPPAPTAPPQVATGSASRAPVTAMRPNSFLHFAYGSNMLTRRLQKRTASATPEGTGYVAGCQLVCDKVSTDGSGKGDMEHTENPGHRVYGVLFRINADEEAKLDKAEGLGRGYRKDEVRVVTLEGTVTARAYIATEKDKSLRPYDWYKGFIVAGATEHGLPQGYIEQLLSMESQADPHSERRARNQALLVEGSET
jgi:AIG2-like family